MKLSIVRRLTLALAAIGLMLPAAWAESELDARRAKDHYFRQAEDALWWGDIDALQRLYDRAQQSSEVNAWNHRRAMQSVRAGIAQVFDYHNVNDAYLRELVLMTERWARERPDAVLPQLLYARTLYARAWHVRGRGYWNAVPTPAKAEFSRLVGQAEAHIADRASMLMKDTNTHLYLMMIGRDAGWSFEKLRAVAEDALARSTADEDDFYGDLAFALLPKWGGSWRQFAVFVDEVDERTGPRRGRELYAELWSVAASNIEGNLFTQTRAQWRLVKEGYERLEAQRSHASHVNRLAYMACLAEDRDTARAAVAKLNGRPDLESWRGGGNGGATNYEACVLWLASQR
jgi:hypothetical protein